jgi:ankyrin repeat protein
VVKLLLAKGADIEAKDILHLTPLMWASKNGQAEMVKLLLNCGARRNIRNSSGQTALDLAKDYPAIIALLR